MRESNVKSGILLKLVWPYLSLHLYPLNSGPLLFRLLCTLSIACLLQFFIICLLFNFFSINHQIIHSLKSLAASVIHTSNPIHPTNFFSSQLHVCFWDTTSLTKVIYVFTFLLIVFTFPGMSYSMSLPSLSIKPLLLHPHPVINPFPLQHFPATCSNLLNLLYIITIHLCLHQPHLMLPFHLL